jgi:catechol 2,3-dioxygenase-like lactoylglutathione lyase family enzyme
VALHRLASITIGVPNVEETCRYYAEFGLTRDGACFSTSDGGEQLRIVESPTRRLIELCIGVDDSDDLDRVTDRLARLGVSSLREPAGVSAIETHSGVRTAIKVLSRISQDPVVIGPYNGPGRVERNNLRAPAVLREEPIRPRKLGHVVIGTPDAEASQRFFVEGVGFKVSDEVRGVAAFMRCSTDHHNLLLQPSPVAFLHHTSWQVDDVDEVGRGAMRMLEGHPERHIWGLGPSLHRLQLLLVPARPGRQFLRVLLRHGHHHRRPTLDTGNVGTVATRPVRMGTRRATLHAGAR